MNTFLAKDVGSHTSNCGRAGHPVLSPAHDSTDGSRAEHPASRVVPPTRANLHRRARPGAAYEWFRSRMRGIPRGRTCRSPSRCGRDFWDGAESSPFAFPRSRTRLAEPGRGSDDLCHRSENFVRSDARADRGEVRRRSRRLGSPVRAHPRTDSMHPLQLGPR